LLVRVEQNGNTASCCCHVRCCRYTVLQICSFQLQLLQNRP